MRNRGCYARGYHSSTALCESNSSNQDKNKESDGPKTDSFFDMAQQWASDYAASKKKGSVNDNERAASIQGAPSSAEESIQTPEDLLEAMGILGGSSRGNTTNNSSDEEKQTCDKDERDTFVDEDPTTDLKGMMRKVLFKFDEFQSTLPKSSKEEGDDGRQAPANLLHMRSLLRKVYSRSLSTLPTMLNLSSNKNQMMIHHPTLTKRFNRLRVSPIMMYPPI